MTCEHDVTMKCNATTPHQRHETKRDASRDASKRKTQPVCYIYKGYNTTGEKGCLEGEPAVYPKGGNSGVVPGKQ